MLEEYVRVGSVQPRYTATGRLSSYAVELWHDGLGEHREVKSSDPGVLENKVEAVLHRWHEKWEAKKLKLAVQATLESAAQETEAAQAALAACSTLLQATLGVDDRVDWDALKKHDPFEWSGERLKTLRYKSGNEPSAIVPVKRPDRPVEANYREEPRWFHYLIPGLVARKQKASRDRWLAAMRDYDQAVLAADEEDKGRRKELERQRALFQADKAKFEEARKSAEAKVDEFRSLWLKKEPAAIIEHADLVLSASVYPDWMKVDYAVGFDPEAKILVIDYRLPSPSEIPTLERVTFVKSRGELTEKHIPESKRKSMFDDICCQITLRTIHEIFEADEVDAISAVTFNGWVEAVNPSTGREERNCILSVQAHKAEFLAFDLARVEPRACFKALKGVAASSLAGLAPVRPILVLDSNDRRFVPSREVVSELDDSVNLASIPWEEFEHLVRELFAKIFSGDGAEVHVTQASRDGGVDAIALDPDPIKGGKIVIQAKRYTNTVGVSAVRDLYGTVVNEGANRGILVTTSNYGPDAYKFAQGKPLTLLNGSNLLALLADHGHKARIDLQEARQRGPS
jgi:Restriction endonuclease